MPTRLAGRGNTLELASGSSPPPLIVLIHPPKEKPKAVLHWNMQHGSMPMENTTGGIDEFVTSAGIIIDELQQQW